MTVTLKTKVQYSCVSLAERAGWLTFVSKSVVDSYLRSFVEDVSSPDCEPSSDTVDVSSRGYAPSSDGVSSRDYEPSSDGVSSRDYEPSSDTVDVSSCGYAPSSDGSVDFLGLSKARLRFETTIERSIKANGIGLHGGLPVDLRICPAPAGSGIIFRRTDLDNFDIPANWKSVARVSYATSVMREGVLISGTERLLSALYGLGIDNAIIELDNLEVPILDGSAQQWVELLQKAGIKELGPPRRYLRIVRDVEIREGDQRITIFPSEAFQIRCDTHYDHPLVGSQRVEFELTAERYARDIAPARTFGFERDVGRMREMGLMRAANAENILMYDDMKILSAEGLRHPDEYCRSRILALIGNLALIGFPLLGYVEAKLPGNSMAIALVRTIISDPNCFAIFTPDKQKAADAQLTVS